MAKPKKIKPSVSEEVKAPKKEEVVLETASKAEEIKEEVKAPVALNRFVLVREYKDGVEQIYIHDPKGRRISSDGDKLSYDSAKRMVDDWNRGAGYPVE